VRVSNNRLRPLQQRKITPARHNYIKIFVLRHIKRAEYYYSQCALLNLKWMGIHSRRCVRRAGKRYENDFIRVKLCGADMPHQLSIQLHGKGIAACFICYQTILDECNPLLHRCTLSKNLQRRSSSVVTSNYIGFNSDWYQQVRRNYFIIIIIIYFCSK